MKRVLFFIVILVFLASYVNAAGVVATVSKEDRNVEAGGEAIFTIKIKNTQVREDTFRLEVSDFAVAPFSDIVERVIFEPGSSVTIPANKEAEVVVKVQYLETAKTEKNYITDLKVKSTANPMVSANVGLSSFLVSSREVIDILLEISEPIVPGKGEDFDIKLVNKANVDFSNLDIFYTSPIFNLEDKASLSALEEKEIRLNLDIDPLTETGEYTMTIRVFSDGSIKGSKNVKFTIGLNPDLKEVEELRRQFLRNRIEIVRENEGNVEVTKTVKYPVGEIQRLFTKTDPQGELVTLNGKKMYQWVFDIPPGDIYKIEIVTDYRTPFFIVAGVLILIGVFFYFKRKDLKISKSIFKFHEAKEKDELTELKILLNIKNRTHKEKYHVKVIDLLPRTIKPDMDFGTLKPAKIEEGSRGIRMIWELERFDPGDERVITYKIKTKLPILGRIELPPAVVQYYGKKKQIVNAKSNKLVYKV